MKDVDIKFSQAFDELKTAFDNFKISCTGMKDSIIKFNKNGKLLSVIYPKKQHPFKKFMK